MTGDWPFGYNATHAHTRGEEVESLRRNRGRYGFLVDRGVVFYEIERSRCISVATDFRR